MKRIAVVFALFGALTASGIASASASAATEIIVKGGGSTEVSTKSGKSVLRSKPVTVECESSESTKSFTVTSGTRTLARGRVLFDHCKAGTAECETKGAKNKGSIETVELLLTIYPVAGGGVDGYAENESTKGTHSGLLAEFECGPLVKVKVTGCVAAEITKVGGFSFTHTAKSILGPTTAEEPNGTKFTCELTVNAVGKAEEETTQTLTSLKEIEVV